MNNVAFVATIAWTWSLDGWIVLTGALCAVAASLLGNFLVLRKLSMLGDAVSHAVLPGLAVAFLISGSRSSLPMFLGAVVVGVLTAVATEWVRKLGRVDEGASMGVVFTTLFALGLLLIVQAADHVDLDAGCVLYGAIELTTLDMVRIGGLEIPRAVVVLVPVLLFNGTFLVLFYKELKICAFDASMATAMGISSTAMHYALMVLVAITAVASFERVGNVLVVAMFVVPPATAYLLTDRLWVMIVLSCILAATGAVLGHVGAIAIPSWFGFKSTTTAGMMAVAVGAFFFLALLFAPKHGLVAKWLHQWRLAHKILCEDILAFLFRSEERSVAASVDRRLLSCELIAGIISMSFAIWSLRRRNEIALVGNTITLSKRGRDSARELVRSHRLWEQYLVEQADMDSTRIHSKAEQLEHFTNPNLLEKLDAETSQPERDPHGTVIPRKTKEPN
ncbi:MAG: metal ABC transporter permease [Pirellula sp.]